METLETALIKAKRSGDPAVWRHLSDIRSGKPRPLTQADHDFLDGLLRGGRTDRATPGLTQIDRLFE